jgi:hypothetical protein
MKKSERIRGPERWSELFFMAAGPAFSLPARHVSKPRIAGLPVKYLAIRCK